MLLNRHRDEYQRIARDSLDSSLPSDSEFQTFEIERQSRGRRSFASAFRRWKSGHGTHVRLSRSSKTWRLLLRCAVAAASLLAVYIAFTPIFNPSYSRRPSHYTGTNPHNEKVFIAANIVDESLIRGAWGAAILELIDVLGVDNVFLSIYENDSGSGTKAALKELRNKVKCKSAIASGHIDLDTFPPVQILPDELRVKRVAYLAEVRNMAIQPLVTGSAGKFDKLLFVNDIVFSPQDAADLLFATKIGPDGRTHYHAACAMDFVNSVKFYDTFALRDSEGHNIGVPFFPWFTGAGHGISRKDVLSGTDAVRVKSCWGGMVAFEAKWFEANKTDVTAPSLEFRAEQEIFWEASECCLIHADLAAAVSATDHGHTEPFDSGIYVNPYIRVAYDATTFSWLEFTRRFERLYAVPHSWLNWIVGRPTFQPRREEEPGDKVMHQEWVFDGPQLKARANRDDLTTEVQEHGHWETVGRRARPGGFCGSRMLLVLKKHWDAGERMWEHIPAPAGVKDYR